MLSANPQQKTINRLKKNSALSIVNTFNWSKSKCWFSIDCVKKKYIHRSLLGEPQSKYVFNIFQNVSQHGGRASGQSWSFDKLPDAHTGSGWRSRREKHHLVNKVEQSNFIYVLKVTIFILFLVLFNVTVRKEVLSRIKQMY